MLLVLLLQTRAENIVDFLTREQSVTFANECEDWPARRQPSGTITRVSESSFAHKLRILFFSFLRLQISKLE